MSFVLCTIYLVFLPFHLWALAVLIGASALAATLIGARNPRTATPNPRIKSRRF